MGPTSDMQDFLAPLRQLVKQLLDLGKCNQGKWALFYACHRWETHWLVCNSSCSPDEECGTTVC